MGWGGVGWGGDVNVRLKLNTPLMLRWAWGGVGMWTFVWSWTRMFVFWPVEKNSTGLHAQWSLKLARQKKVRISCGRVAKRKKNDIFLKYVYFKTATKHWKGCHFLTMVMRLHARFRTRRDIYDIYIYIYIILHIYIYIYKMYTFTYPILHVSSFAGVLVPPLVLDPADLATYRRASCVWSSAFSMASDDVHAQYRTVIYRYVYIYI